MVIIVIVIVVGTHLIIFKVLLIIRTVIFNQLKDILS